MAGLRALLGTKVYANATGVVLLTYRVKADR
jgi:hypothetical protein